MTIMTNELGPGERAAAANKRRVYWIVGGLFAAGLPIGFFAAMLEDGAGPGVLQGTLPPWFALLAAAVFLVAVIGGALLWQARMDELDRRDNLQANSAAGAAIVIGYPSWFLLWKGGLTGAPDAFWLFAAALGAGAVTYLYLKLRQRV